MATQSGNVNPFVGVLLVQDVCVCVIATAKERTREAKEIRFQNEDLRLIRFLLILALDGVVKSNASDRHTTADIAWSPLML
mmetsp:Transcript_694/g.1604  ORF Transcript_694/g.1604 Transcript_694/m.1604 type:complete len:81 (-) Transcript_694:222-464(-)